VDLGDFVASWLFGFNFFSFLLNPNLTGWNDDA
jgi:hypothetical protein